MSARGDSGRADAVALAAAVILAAAAIVPAVRLRSHPALDRAREDANAGRDAAPAEGAAERERFGAALARAEAFRPVLANSAFRPEPARSVRPPAPSPAAMSAKFCDLDGKVEEGRLILRWKPVPDSRGTRLRIEGLGGGEPVDRELGPTEGELSVPVAAAQGTAVARAVPMLVEGAAEARVAIPYRVPCEVVRAEQADPAAGLALLVLRRPYDGRQVEASFAVHADDDVGGLAAVGEGGAVVEFRTAFVVEEIRRIHPAGPTPPEFLADGRVRRDAEGRPIRRPAVASELPSVAVVVLRGVDDERRVLEAR